MSDDLDDLQSRLICANAVLSLVIDETVTQPHISDAVAAARLLIDRIIEDIDALNAPKPIITEA